MGFHIGHIIKHAVKNITKGVESVVHDAEKIVQNTAHAVTHPVQTIESSVKNVGHAVTDLAHGRFMHAAQDLGHAVDAAHIWKPAVGSITHGPVGRTVAQAWHGFERPTNKILAKGIKDITGHNVFGSHPLQSVAEIAATVASMGGYSVVGGITSAIEAGVGAAFGSAAEAGVTTAINAVGDFVGEAENLIGDAVGGALHAVNDVATEAIPGLSKVEEWGAQKAAEASNYFSSALHQAHDYFIPPTTTGYTGPTVGQVQSTWSANNAGSIFNNGQGIGATGLHAGDVATGNSISTLQGAALKNTDMAGFGFGTYAKTAGAGQMGIVPIETAKLGAGTAGLGAGGYTGFADAITGKLGTGGVGLYGETAEGTIQNALNNGGMTDWFNYGYNSAVPGQGDRTYNESSRQNNDNSGGNMFSNIMNDITGEGSKKARQLQLLDPINFIQATKRTTLDTLQGFDDEMSLDISDKIEQIGQKQQNPGSGYFSSNTLNQAAQNLLGF